MDLQAARRRLLEKQEELVLRVARTHKHIYQKDEPVSAKFSEQSTQMDNAELVRALDEEGRLELRQIQNALARIESGEYLTCASCGKPIGEKRLEAVPFTDRCIACAK